MPHAMLIAGLLALFAQATPPPAPSVKVGDPAPTFTLRYLAAGPDGKVALQTVSLADFKGKKTVILAFFPAAFSPGWTTELSRFRDNAGKVAAVNAQVIGVSVDSVWANEAFADQLHLDFPLLSDAKRTVSRAYGVYDDANDVARRTTFVIDEHGIVRHITQSTEALDPNLAIGACPLPQKR